MIKHFARCVLLAAIASAAADTPVPAGQASSAAQIAAELGLKESERPLRETLSGWRTPAKVMINVSDDAARLDFMKAAMPPGVTLIGVKSKEEALARVGEVDGIITATSWCRQDLIEAGKRLRWVHVNAAGVNLCPLKLMSERGIVLTNEQRVYSSEISDHVMAMVLALTRGLDGALAAQRQAKWTGDFVAPSRLWGLEGRTLLVAGLGGIGTGVAKKAHGMGMRVIATRGSSREGPDYVEYVGLAEELPALIGKADVVVNALPLTPQTQGLFNSAMFARMRQHAYFISVGRGGTTVTADLLAALKDGTIGGAGLDVVDPEPLPDGHPLWSAPNIIITPHMAASGQGAGDERAWIVMREQLRRFVAGDRLYSVVDLERGY